MSEKLWFVASQSFTLAWYDNSGLLSNAPTVNCGTAGICGNKGNRAATGYCRSTNAVQQWL